MSRHRLDLEFTRIFDRLLVNQSVIGCTQHRPRGDPAACIHTRIPPTRPERFSVLIAQTRKHTWITSKESRWERKGERWACRRRTSLCLFNSPSAQTPGLLLAYTGLQTRAHIARPTKRDSTSCICTSMYHLYMYIHIYILYSYSR